MENISIREKMQQAAGGPVCFILFIYSQIPSWRTIDF